MVDVLLISKPQYDLDSFLTISSNMLGYSPARGADASNLKGQPHLLVTLAAFRDKTIKDVKNAQDVVGLLHYTFIIAAENQDMLFIIEVLSGMEIAYTETRVRGICAIIVSGNLYQWKCAIAKGFRTDIQECFDKIYNQFCNIGLEDIFGRKNEYQQRDYKRLC